MVNAKDISIINFTLCEYLKKDAVILRPSSLKMLETQLQGPLSNKSTAHQAAFTSYWLNSQRPYEASNTSTAVVAAFKILDYLPEEKLFSVYSIAVKQGAKVQELIGILEDYV